MQVFWIIVMALVMLWAIGMAIRDHKRPGGTAADRRDGWLYFIGSDDGPIKVGMSAYEPSASRLPELKSMSPFPLKIYHKERVADRRAAERAVHVALAPYRDHGEWFDRDAALFYVAHRRGQV